MILNRFNSTKWSVCCCGRRSQKKRDSRFVSCGGEEESLVRDTVEDEMRGRVAFCFYPRRNRFLFYFRGNQFSSRLGVLTGRGISADIEKWQEWFTRRRSSLVGFVSAFPSDKMPSRSLPPPLSLSLALSLSVSSLNCHLKSHRMIRSIDYLTQKKPPSHFVWEMSRCFCRFYLRCKTWSPSSRYWLSPVYLRQWWQQCNGEPSITFEQRAKCVRKILIQLFANHGH